MRAWRRRCRIRDHLAAWESRSRCASGSRRGARARARSRTRPAPDRYTTAGRTVTISTGARRRSRSAAWSSTLPCSCAPTRASGRSTSRLPRSRARGGNA
ncbi:hypothetical protein HBB16_01030 [Pseudonocardia sp. MCCB 268]|nr:hypothetical protein [Pseudonocardia cytotoxica]